MSSVIKVTFITVLFNASHVLQPNHLPVTVAEAEFICESGRNCCYTQAPLLCRDRAVMVQISPGHWCVHITVVSNREKQWKWCPLGWVLDGCSIMSSSVTSSAGLSVPLARHQAVWCGQHSCGLRCHDSVYKKEWEWCAGVMENLPQATCSPGSLACGLCPPKRLTMGPIESIECIVSYNL